MVKKLALEVFKTTVGCLFYCAVFLAIAYACMGCYRFGFQIFSNPVCDAKATSLKEVEITQTDKEIDVTKRLQQEGVVQDYKVAYIRLQFSEYKDKLQPGKYQVSGSMPLDDILAMLSCVAEGEEEDGMSKEDDG